MDLSLKKMDVSSTNGLILNSLLKMVIPLISVVFLMRTAGSCVAKIKSFVEMGHHGYHMILFEYLYYI